LDYQKGGHEVGASKTVKTSLGLRKGMRGGEETSKAGDFPIVKGRNKGRPLTTLLRVRKASSKRTYRIGHPCES